MCNHNMASSREVAFIEDEPIRRSEQAALASLIQSSFALTSHCKTAKPPSSSNHPQKSHHSSHIPAPPQSISNPSTASSTDYSQCSCLCPRFPSSTFFITIIPVIFTKNSNARPMVANSGVLHTSLPSTSQEIMPCQTWAVLLKAVPIVKPRRRGWQTRRFAGERY